MRIMEIISGTLLNGAMAHCALVSRELARRGHSVTVVCRRGAWIAQELAGTAVEVMYSDLKRFPLGDSARCGRRGPPPQNRGRADPHEPGQFLRRAAALAHAACPRWPPPTRSISNRTGCSTTW